MATNRPTIDVLKRAMQNPHSIRNTCILAHVDHGKTTLADSLLATNGLLSQRSAGQIRYLDDRQDEQERGITMKSSAVSLYYKVGDADMVLNLVDTPGHIDFSTEVSAAVRLCDGAFIVVDVVEGVCAQTRDAIKQAYDEHVKMILVLNKMDRLVVELQQSPTIMFQTILRVIEDCNVIVAELCKYNVDSDEADKFSFCPKEGNVIFACASDGWAATIKSICETCFELVEGETPDSLYTKIWDFNCYVDPETKLVMKGGYKKQKENVFTQLFLKTIWFLYYTFVIRMDRDKLPMVLKKLKITKPTRDMQHKCPRTQIKAILQVWCPLAPAVMQQCFDVIPSPGKAIVDKLRYLIFINRYFREAALNDRMEKMLRSMKEGCPCTNIVYISKMFSVNKKNLSQNKPKIAIPTRIRTPHIEGVNTTEHVDNKIENVNNKIEGVDNKIEKNISCRCQLEDVTNGHVRSEINSDSKESDEVDDTNQDYAIMALGRIFSGTLRVNENIYLLEDNYNPVEMTGIKRITIKELYMMVGRELYLTDEVPFGNICAIGSLDNLIMRTATLSSSTNCFPLKGHIGMEPIVRNTIEPVNPRDLPKLRLGLKRLQQSDSCVQVVLQDTGEHVLITAGDVHLEKCLLDLKTKFINFDVNVSKPMVSFRETVYYPKPDDDSCDFAIAAIIPEFGITFQISVIPMPTLIEEVVRANHELLLLVEEHRQNLTSFPSHMEAALKKLKAQLTAAFQGASGSWAGYSDQIWSFGKGRDCINMLINNTDGYQRSIFCDTDEHDPRGKYDRDIVNGFQVCCCAGPICEEPLTNCVFVISNYDVNERSVVSPPPTANLTLTIKRCLRDAIMKVEQRLVEPIFTTDIQVNVHILGKVYSVIGRRHGKVLEAIGMDKEEKIFTVKAQIPVVESEGFVNEIRKTTSGHANPTLRFTHYEIIESDPYFEGEEASDEANDVCASSALRANKLMKAIRRRKGLLVDEQVVVHAEKQRTLNKKK